MACSQFSTSAFLTKAKAVRARDANKRMEAQWAPPEERHTWKIKKLKAKGRTPTAVWTGSGSGWKTIQPGTDFWVVDRCDKIARKKRKKKGLGQRFGPPPGVPVTKPKKCAGLKNGRLKKGYKWDKPGKCPKKV